MGRSREARVPQRPPFIGRPVPATLRNLARNAVRPGYLGIMVGKVVQRVSDRPYAASASEALRWAAARSRTADDLAGSIDAPLWDEACAFGARLDARVRDVRARLQEDPKQGGGHAALLYFLVRLRRPAVAVETGVALGVSTAAILGAMEVNGIGHLHSSDLPAFRLRDPERHIGAVVDEDLRDRWTLDLRGDRKAISRVVRDVGQIDFLHYDSDKTFRGRKHVVDRVGARLAADAILVMDDIQENVFFRDYADSRTDEGEVIGYRRKYLGIVGLARRPAR